MAGIVRPGRGQCFYVSESFPRPKTLITPALFSRPPHSPPREKRENSLQGHEDEGKCPNQVPLSRGGGWGGRERGRGEGLGRGIASTVRMHGYSETIFPARDI